MRRQLRVELLRGTAPVAGLVMFGASVWMLVVHPEDWSGRWAGLASYIRVSMLVLAALMVTAGAWQAGRERRRQIEEQLVATARPAWQPLLVAWLAVSIGGTGGLLVAFAGAAVLVGRLATYAGGGWWWTAAVGVLALWTASALGVLVGRLVPLRVVAPIAGLATYLGLAVVAYGPPVGAAWLSPLHSSWGTERLVPDGTHLRQAAWLLALTVTLLAIAARLRWAALASGALAVLAAVPIVTGPGTGHLRADPGAIRPVCTVRGPEVCLALIDSYLLDDIAAVVQPVLRRVEGIPGAPHRAAAESLRPPGQSAIDGGDTVWLNLNGQSTALGGIKRLDWLQSNAVGFAGFYCEFGRYDQRASDALGLARGWLGVESGPDDPAHARLLARLMARPLTEQRAWFAAYLEAAQSCDQDRLIQLGQLS